MHYIRSIKKANIGQKQLKDKETITLFNNIEYKMPELQEMKNEGVQTEEIRK